jgi:hypothetical protein
MEVPQLDTFVATGCEGMNDQTRGVLLAAVNATDWRKSVSNIRQAKSMPILASQPLAFAANEKRPAFGSVNQRLSNLSRAPPLSSKLRSSLRDRTPSA